MDKSQIKKIGSALIALETNPHFNIIKETLGMVVADMRALPSKVQLSDPDYMNKVALLHTKANGAAYLNELLTEGWKKEYIRTLEEEKDGNKRNNRTGRGKESREFVSGTARYT